MKKIIIALLILSSCVHRSSEKIIYSKDYDTDIDCICNYKYDEGFKDIWFQDSCHKFYIGDTIK